MAWRCLFVKALTLFGKNFGDAMFEDSLVESTGRIRTHSRQYAAGSFVLQAALVAVVVLIPYLYPAALPPRAYLTTLASPPPPPAEPVPARHMARVSPARTIQSIALIAPRVIPRHVTPEAAGYLTTPGPAGFIHFHSGYAEGSMPSLGPPPAPPVVSQPESVRPLRVSAGVAQGQLLVPIQPVYPEIAKSAHVQGTVVIDAVISNDGTVEQARVVSGPPLLTAAALSAVTRARYRPYKLNGKPIAVETTIHIIFALDK